MQNANLDISSEYEPLAPVLMDSGEKSGYYPADLGSLFSYDGKCEGLDIGMPRSRYYKQPTV